MYNIRKVIIQIKLIFIIIIIIFNCGCFEKDKEKDKTKESEIVTIKDAYCSLDGYFQFTIVNLIDRDINLDIQWTLNEIQSEHIIYQGEDSAELKGLEERILSFSITPGLIKYDARNLIINISLFNDGKEIYYYHELKSTYNWDYSVLPPVKYKEQPDFVYVTFETFVSRNEQNNFIVQFENVTYNPSNSNHKLRLNEFYVYIVNKTLYGHKYLEEEWRTSDILSKSTQNQTSPIFFDVDNDETISDYDYYIFPFDLIKDPEKQSIEFETACSFIYKGQFWDDSFKVENRNAFIIKNISTNPENPIDLIDLEFTIDIMSINDIHFYKMTLVDGENRLIWDLHLQEVYQYDQNYTYSGSIGDIYKDDHFVDSELYKRDEYFFYIELKDFNVNERLILYKLRI